MSTILSCFHLKLRDISPQDLVKALKAQTLVKAASLPRFFIRRPNTLDAEILNTPWDLIVFLDGAFPAELEKHVETSYRTSWEVPTQALNNLESVTANIKAAPKRPLSFFKPDDSSCVVPDENEDDLGRTAALQAKARELLKDHDGPVTCVAMLNFFKGGAKAYVTYYEECVKNFTRLGSTVKLPAEVVSRPGDSSKGREGEGEEGFWTEAGLIYWPSIAHFCDMLWNEQYQEVNKASRLGIVRDIILICTTDIDLSSL